MPILNFYLPVTSYKIYVKLLLAYCNEVLVLISGSIIDKFEKNQNQTMHFISGAARSTPLAAMQLLTKLHLIKFEIHRNLEIKISLSKSFIKIFVGFHVIPF